MRRVPRRRRLRRVFRFAAVGQPHRAVGGPVVARRARAPRGRAARAAARRARRPRERAVDDAPAACRGRGRRRRPGAGAVARVRVDVLRHAGAADARRQDGGRHRAGRVRDLARTAGPGTPGHARRRVHRLRRAPAAAGCRPVAAARRAFPAPGLARGVAAALRRARRAPDFALPAAARAGDPVPRLGSPDDAGRDRASRACPGGGRARLRLRAGPGPERVPVGAVRRAAGADLQRRRARGAGRLRGMGARPHAAGGADRDPGHRTLRLGGRASGARPGRARLARHHAPDPHARQLGGGRRWSPVSPSRAWPGRSTWSTARRGRDGCSTSARTRHA